MKDLGKNIWALPLIYSRIAAFRLRLLRRKSGGGLANGILLGRN
jgi:hypothetical protein